MKFEAEDPSEVSKAGSGGVDRSQGAARAISACRVHCSFAMKLTTSLVIHRPRLKLEGSRMV